MIEYIYYLICPIEKTVKYVGKSKNPKTRYKQHISKLDRLNTEKKQWLLNLFAKNLLPEIIIVEKCVENGREREQFHVDKNKNTILNIHNPKKGEKSIPNRYPKNVKYGKK